MTRGVYGPGPEREVVGGGKEGSPSELILLTAVRAGHGPRAVGSEDGGVR